MVEKDLETVNQGVRTILIKKHGPGGAARVYSSLLQNVMTGPNGYSGVNMLNSEHEANPTIV